MRKFNLSFAFMVLAVLSACSSPEEKALDYLEDGQKSLAEGEMVKARLDFQNALQLNQNLTEALYGLALIAEDAANWEEMYNLLQNVLERNPDHVQAQIRKGRLLLGAGQLDEALEISSLTMELVPSDPDALALRAAIFFRLEDIATADELARQTLELQPDNVDALAVLASIAIREDDPEAAIDWLEQGLDSNVGGPALNLLKIQALTALQNLPAIEAEYRNLIAMYPETDAFRHELASFYMDHGREADAEQIFRDIMQANPEDLEARLNVIRFVNSTRGIEAALAEADRMVTANPANVDLHFMQAQLYSTAGQLEKVQEILQSVAQSAPATPDQLRAKGLLASLYSESGKVQEADDLVAEILAEDPRNEEALILKATRSMDMNMLDQAVAELRTVLRDSPSSARALALLGRAHDLDGSPQLANDVYERAVSASEFQPEYSIAYARFLNSRNSVARSADILEASRRRNPDHVELLTLLAQIRLNQGNFSAAQEVADHLRTLDEAGPLGDEIMGNVYAGQQDYQQSINAFRSAWENSPSNIRPVVSLIRTYVASGREDEAREFLQSILDVNETSGIRLLLGQLEASLGNEALAKEYFQMAIASNSANTSAYTSLAGIEARNGGVQAAMAVIDDGLEANPGDFDLSLIKAGMLESEGEVDAAIEVYEELIITQPNAEVVVNNLASLLSDYSDDQASLERANALAQRFQGSNIPYFMDTLGWTYYRLGNVEDASPLIEDAAELMPTTPVFRYHLGKAYLAAGNREGALSEFQAVLDLAEGSGDSLPYLAEVEAIVAEL